MISFGECELFDNVRWPSVQKWFAKRVGFGYPHFPYGRWYLPLPRKHRIVLVVGQPLVVPTVQDPTLAEIDSYHAQYFQKVRALFDKYKKEAGYPAMELVISQ